MPLQLVDKEECSTTKNQGTRRTDRKKLEDKRKEISTTKELIRFKTTYGRNYICTHKYKYLIYWDKVQHRQIQKCIKICKVCETELTEQNRVGRYLICKECHSKKKHGK